MLILALATLAAAAWTSRRHSAPPGPLLTVAFAGYTNLPDGRVMATFALRNNTRSDLLIDPPKPKLRAQGEWRETSATGRVTVLQRRSQLLVAVSKPTNAEAWRLEVFHAAAPSRLAQQALRLWGALPWKPDLLNDPIQRAGGLQLRLAESDVLGE